MNYINQINKSTPCRHTEPHNMNCTPWSTLFFPATILYYELLLRAFDKDTIFFDLALLRSLLFSAAAGLLIFLILDLLPWRAAARIAGGVIIAMGAVLFCVERGCRATFGLYYGVAFMGRIARNVIWGFGPAVMQAALGLVPFILLSLIPLLAFVLLREKVIRDYGQKNTVRIILVAVLVTCQLAGWVLSAFGGAANYYTYEFTVNTGVNHFGLLNSVRLELEYIVAGTPVPPLGAFMDDPISTPSAHLGQSDGYNTLDIDFGLLAETETNKTIKCMHQYFSTLTPSAKNEYTGLFEGKNLILITAEAFATPAIDEELTPTLYRLSHDGFVFQKFYQPDWTQSTCGGEFAVTTGVIPNWVNSKRGSLAAQASIDNQMPITLARLFASRGYNVPAWHNGTYTYYDRNLYLSNFGYDYAGCEGGGLELPYNGWPRSDLEMMEATADSYINDYVENGTPFHAYYMTISGHGGYSWNSNEMSNKHREMVEAKFPDLSETSQAYLACNIELDLALKCLVDKLEASGIADDTLIVMTGDHYPYRMITEDNVDHYNELRGFEDTESVTSRYRNTLLMWSACIDGPIVVDTPCSSIDIVPTICNLFGLDYDSRLYSGRDIFATNYEPDQYSNCMPLVVFANNKGKGNSWITAAGTYECSTKTFIPNGRGGVDEDYVHRVHRLVAARIIYSKLIIQEDYYRYVFLDSE